MTANGHGRTAWMLLVILVLVTSSVAVAGHTPFPSVTQASIANHDSGSNLQVREIPRAFPSTLSSLPEGAPSLDLPSNSPNGSSGPYQMTFTESGLPNGTYWYVWVYPSTSSPFVNSSTTSSLTFAVGPGSYPYVVYSDDRYNVPTPASGTVEVSASNVTVGVTFSHGSLALLTISETGLGNDTWWFVSVYSFATGYFNAESNSSSTSLPLPNGTYLVMPQNVSSNATDVLYLVSPLVQNVTIDGSNVTIGVVFVAYLLGSLTFLESGLPNGTAWKVDLPNGTIGWPVNWSTSDLFSGRVASGTYAFTVLTNGTFYTPDPANGSVTVNGSGLTVDVRFTLAEAYMLSFHETGLPTGTFWSVKVTNPMYGEFGVGSSVAKHTINLPKGTYSFKVGTTDKQYAARPGTFTVGKSAAAKTVKFVLQKFKTTFTETGLPSGSRWCLVFTGGAKDCSKKASLSFYEPNGTYSYTLATTRRGYAGPAGSFTVDGAPVSESVTFST